MRWLRSFAAGFAVVAFTLCGAGSASAQTGRFADLTPVFARGFDESAEMPPAERVAHMRAALAAALPDFYRANPANPQRLDQRIAAALEAYPQQRLRIGEVAARMETRYSTAGKRFRRFFPDYRPSVNVYVLHSLGSMDGGVRDIAGKTALVFGADMIARIHDEETVGPLLDHELFHTYYAPVFPGCMPLWCRLWDEGLATYAAQQLNPGASDRALLLEYPRPIRPEVEPRFAEAVCLTLARLDSTEDADVGGMFDGSEGLAGWPPRFGYYVGLRVAAKAAEKMPLRKLAKLGPAKVRPLVEETLRSLADCSA